LIEISHKISLVTDEKITTYFNSEWKSFINEKVSNWLNMFNRKLCYEEKTTNLFISSLERKTEETTTATTTATENNNIFSNEEKNETTVIIFFSNLKFVF